MQAYIQLSSIQKTYPMHDFSVSALRDINLSIKKGDFVSIGGPSGSGKTTLLNIIGALDYPSKGELWIDHQNVAKMSEKQRTWLRRDYLGFVFQSYNLLPVLTAIENTEYTLMLQGVSRSERLERAQTILQQVGLTDRMHHKPNQLSGGQQQRLAVARALVTKPKLLLADEPTGNLDSKTSDELISLIESLHRHYQTTVIISSHDKNVLSRAHTRVWVKDGVVDSIDS